MWGLGDHTWSQTFSPYGAFANQCHRKSSETGDYVTDFPGIQPGDVLGFGHFYTDENNNRKWTGHVAVYMDNNIIYEFYTKHWDKTPTGRGCRKTGYRTEFQWYVSYDNSSASYDPDTTNPDTDNIPDIHDVPTPNPNRADLEDSSNYLNSVIPLMLQYTPRRIGMKPFRPVKG